MVSKLNNITRKSLLFLKILLCCTLVFSCGQAYFPVELKTVSRSERFKKQQDEIVDLVPMTAENIKSANTTPYLKKVIEAKKLNKPAMIISEKEAIIERFPDISDPGNYILGDGDILSFAQILGDRNVTPSYITRKIVISEDGFVNIYEIGRLKASGLTLPELEDLIYKQLVQEGVNSNFELNFSQFKSKMVDVIGEDLVPRKIPYTNRPIYLESVLQTIKFSLSPGQDGKITLVRNNEQYVFSIKNLVENLRSKYRLFPGDKVVVKRLNYKKENVLIVGETGAQTSFPISAELRPTLSDTIFSGSVLNGVTSDFSQIYVLRKKKTRFDAYHLDITNPARISLANKFEMRPEDIVFVAAQPLTLYSRSLQQILGSIGLTQQSRDIVRSELGR